MAAQAKTAKRRTTSSRTSTRTSAKTTTSGGRETAAARRTSSTTRGRRATVPVPVVMPRVKVMKVHVPGPGMSYVGDAGRLAVEHLPSPDRLAFYGGLGVAAVFGIIDWPVAAAIGIGTMVARRAFRGRRETVRTSVVSQTPAGKSTSARRRTASRTGPARPASRSRTTRTRTVETV